MKKLLFHDQYDASDWVHDTFPHVVRLPVDGDPTNAWDWCCEQFGQPAIYIHPYPIEIELEQIPRWQWWGNPRFRDPNDALLCKLRWG